MAKDQRGQDVTLADGSLDFSGGVNSYAVTTVQSPGNPNGLRRNQLAWLDNATVRGGGITQRSGWHKRGNFPTSASGLYQGKFMYEPDSEDPYLIVAIGGDIWKMSVDDPVNAVNLSEQYTENTPAYTITGQVCVELKQTSVTPAAGTLQNEGTNSTIGFYKTFIWPGNGNTVRVPLATVYSGALLGTITIATGTLQITGSFGWTANAVTSQKITLPPYLSRYYFCQAEQFLVIQAGDLSTLPLIWDGVVLRRSLGLSGAGSLGATPFGRIGVFTSAPFALQGLGGTVVVNTTTTYTGNVGDYLSGLASMSASGNTVGSNVTGFSYVAFSGIVSAIGANNVTLTQLGFTAPWMAGSVIPTNTPLVLLYFFNGTPSYGGGAVVGTPEIPPATAMDYFMGRLWYAQGRIFSAGDIVGNQSSGTVERDFRDSVLKVTENPLAVGGDGFTVPTNAGNIRAIKHSANINTQLGQGQLYIFTRRSVYSLSVPVTRNDWINANTNNGPLMTVAQVTNGSVNDRSVVAQNGDLFFQSFEPAIRSQIVAVRNFQQWGNVPISINENRILQFTDRSLLQFASGITFSNRLLQTALPYLTPVGAAFRALIPLNFDVISTLDQQLPPVWEGMLEGLDILELSTGDFGGRPRAFAAAWSPMNREIQLWEITDAEKFDNEDSRVVWYAEFPAFTFGSEFQLKRLVSAELWIDRIYGEVMFSLDWRPDGDSCWYKWHEWKLCTSRNSCEDVHNPQCLYPQVYQESFRQTIKLPVPPNVCQKVSRRPAAVGYQFQPRLTIKGFCRIRGILLKAEMMDEPLYGEEMVCG